MDKNTSAVENYQKNFVTNVIFRIDFPEILENQDQFPSEIIEKIKEKFPICNQLIGQSFEIETKTNTKTIKHEEKKSWRLANSDNTKIVVIDPKFLTFESLKYTDFQDFIDDVKFIFKHFVLLYSVAHVNRIGLRYINQIKWGIKEDPLDWENLLDPNLYMVPKNFVDESDSILRAMNVLEIEENEYYLRFQFGLFNSEFPSTIAQKEFVLDYDCYTDNQVDSSEIYDKGEEFNKIIYKWFERSIGEKLRSYMRNENGQKAKETGKTR